MAFTGSYLSPFADAMQGWQQGWQREQERQEKLGHQKTLDDRYKSEWEREQKRYDQTQKEQTEQRDRQSARDQITLLINAKAFSFITPDMLRKAGYASLAEAAGGGEGSDPVTEAATPQSPPTAPAPVQAPAPAGPAPMWLPAPKTMTRGTAGSAADPTALKAAGVQVPAGASNVMWHPKGNHGFTYVPAPPPAPPKPVELGAADTTSGQWLSQAPAPVFPSVTGPPQPRFGPGGLRVLTFGSEGKTHREYQEDLQANPPPPPLAPAPVASVAALTAPPPPAPAPTGAAALLAPPPPTPAAPPARTLITHLQERYKEDQERERDERRLRKIQAWKGLKGAAGWAAKDPDFAGSGMGDPAAWLDLPAAQAPQTPDQIRDHEAATLAALESNPAAANAYAKNSRFHRHLAGTFRYKPPDPPQATPPGWDLKETPAGWVYFHPTQAPKGILTGRGVIPKGGVRKASSLFTAEVWKSQITPYKSTYRKGMSDFIHPQESKQAAAGALAALNRLVAPKGVKFVDGGQGELVMVEADGTPLDSADLDGAPAAGAGAPGQPDATRY